MRVEIYFNLHKKVFSMRHKGKVIAHVCNATLKNVTYVVQPAGRARVLRDKNKTFVDRDDEPLYKSDIAYLALHSDTGKPFISTFNVEID